MARRSRNDGLSETAREEGVRIARGTQRPGQTKEQTRLIAQGIQKGIEQYKKQHKARARELDRKLKKVNQVLGSSDGASAPAVEVRERIIYRQHWLPWALLVASWLGIGAWLLLD